MTPPQRPALDCTLTPPDGASKQLQAESLPQAAIPLCPGALGATGRASLPPCTEPARAGGSGQDLALSPKDPGGAWLAAHPTPRVTSGASSPRVSSGMGTRTLYKHPLWGLCPWAHALPKAETRGQRIPRDRPHRRPEGGRAWCTGRTCGLQRHDVPPRVFARWTMTGAPAPAGRGTRGRCTCASPATGESHAPL